MNTLQCVRCNQAKTAEQLGFANKKQKKLFMACKECRSIGTAEECVQKNIIDNVLPEHVTVELIISASNPNILSQTDNYVRMLNNSRNWRSKKMAAVVRDRFINYCYHDVIMAIQDTYKSAGVDAIDIDIALNEFFYQDPYEKRIVIRPYDHSNQTREFWLKVV